MLERINDWPSLLGLCIKSRAARPFKWGDDCMTWAADCIEAQTGIDTLQAYRGKYKSARGALSCLKRIDGVQLPIDLADKLWGPRVHIAMARLGDIVVADVDVSPQTRGMGPSVGLCYGRNSIFVGTDGGPGGLVTLETRSLEHCYQPCHSLSKL